MKADAPHLPRAAPIEAYGQGGFIFDTMSHRGSLLCLPDAMWAWPIEHARGIDRASLLKVFENSAAIDTLLIGTGNDVWRVPGELRDALRRYHIGVDAMQTGAAIRTWNIMMGERRRVAAALIAVP